MEQQQTQGVRLYDTADIERLSGISGNTLKSWVNRGLTFPCKGSPSSWYVFSESEKDRVLEAKRLAGDHPRRTFQYLIGSRHESTPGAVFAADEIIAETGRSRNTVVNAMIRMGAFSRRSCGCVLPVEMRQRVIDDLNGRARRGPGKAPSAKPVPGQKTVSVSIKGIKIELSRDDAEKLASEIIDQL